MKFVCCVMLLPGRYNSITQKGQQQVNGYRNYFLFGFIAQSQFSCFPIFSPVCVIPLVKQHENQTATPHRDESTDSGKIKRKKTKEKKRPGNSVLISAMLHAPSSSCYKSKFNVIQQFLLDELSSLCSLQRSILPPPSCPPVNNALIVLHSCLRDNLFDKKSSVSP